MAFDGFTKRQEKTVMSQMNMVPLIDVMLVLLVIFMVTAPLMSHAVKLDLPRATSRPDTDSAPRMVLAIAENGAMTIDGKPAGPDEARAIMAEAARRRPDTELKLLADARTDYEKVASALAAASNAGLAKIAFVTTPKKQ